MHLVIFVLAVCASFVITHALVLVLAAGLGFAWWKLHGWLPKHRVRVMRMRLRLRMRPGRGHATLTELWLYWGRFAAFRKSARSRRMLTTWHRILHPSEHSILAGRAQFRHGLRVPLEEHVLVQAPPRSGKTGWLGDVILHYPGPVLSTTTKHDVFELTSGIRSRLGPVHVFNPQRIGGVPSTFRWSPIHGCHEPAVAIRRADAITRAVSLDGTEDASFWTSKASSYMRALFHAAALAGKDMRTVVRWTLEGAEEAERILLANHAGQWAAEVGELRGEAAKTAATIKMVMSRALGFMTDPALAQSVLPTGGETFSIPDFLRECGTLYMIADSAAAEAPLAPLFAAMAAEVHWVAVQLGQASEGGRLDPPLLMGLDEVTQICPIALPVWLADSGGKGVQVIAVAHGDAQLASRWKDDGRRIIADTAGVRLLLPGITDTQTLEVASKLCGDAAFKEHGQHHTSRHSAMTVDMVRSLPPGRALVIRGSMAPVVARLQMAWNDRSYRAARRDGEHIASLPAAAEVPVIDPVSAPAQPLASEHRPVKRARNGHGKLGEVLPLPLPFGDEQ
jgi:type IV secretion system protein VirD4